MVRHLYRVLDKKPTKVGTSHFSMNMGDDETPRMAVIDSLVIGARSLAINGYLCVCVCKYMLRPRACINVDASKHTSLLRVDRRQQQLLRNARLLTYI